MSITLLHLTPKDPHFSPTPAASGAAQAPQCRTLCPARAAVPVTGPQADEVMVPMDTETVDATGDVPRVAIREVGEAVISATQEDGTSSAPGSERG
ncbi:hypothetical protein ACFY1G_03185 [Streptomyces olivaceus]|uniref:hypothetical protein n=1 Tax=Streptomyces olivaceus TaxID=47716 RepID=UPI0036A34521